MDERRRLKEDGSGFPKMEMLGAAFGLKKGDCPRDSALGISVKATTIMKPMTLFEARWR